MKTKKKNRFFTFIFSCMPGAGEMYMGFMNRGVSMMLLFVLTIVISVWLEQAVLMAICIVEWFFSFFYVNHIASLNDEEFAMVKDISIFETVGLQLPGVHEAVNKYSKVIACIMIFLGGCFLWNTFARILSWMLPDRFNFISRTMRVIGNYLPSIAIGFGIIYLGLRMLEGKKVEVVSRVQATEDKPYKSYETNEPYKAHETHGQVEPKEADVTKAVQDSEKKPGMQEENREGM